MWTTRDGTVALVQRKEDNREIHHSIREGFITPENGRPVKREEDGGKL